MALINPTITDKKKITLSKALLLAGLTAGTLDILSAILLQTALAGVFRPVVLLQAIASGAFGSSAMEGGTAMALAGIFFHYLIAYCWVGIYFFLFMHIALIRRYKIWSGLFYGVLVWLIMNCLVLPLSQLKTGPFRWDWALMNMVILMLMIGIPSSLFANWYYRSANPKGEKN